MLNASLWGRMRRRATTTRLGIVMGASLVAGCLGSGLALADAPNLGVVNLGQPSALVIAGQPALTVPSSGACTSPFTLESESACSAGAWPALGGAWGPPTEDVAGGDELQLTFSSAVSSVTFASTSNYPTGLTDPSGQPIANYDVLTPTAATSASATIWRVKLPSLDIRALSGYTFSVVADDTSGYHDYPFMVRSPRYADELTKCGEAYYSTGNSQYLCLSNGAPPGIPTGGGQTGAPSTSSPAIGDQPAPIQVGPPLGASTAIYSHGRLRLEVAVPTSGTLTISIPTRGRHRQTSAKRHVAHGGNMSITEKITKLRFVGHHQIVLHMVLHASTGFFTRTQTIAVR